MNRSFPALAGHQGGSTFYTAVLTLRDVVDLLPPADPKVPPERRAQRPLQEGRAHRLADYVVGPSYTLPPLTVSVSQLRYADGILTVPEGAAVICNDGQHRRRGVEIALAEKSALAEDTVCVLFYEDGDVDSAKQRFADLNSGQPVSKSARLLYDLRKPSKGRDAALRPPFTGLVEMQAASASGDKIWTLAGLDKTPCVEKADFWEALLGGWRPAIEAGDARKRYVWAHNVGLQGIGMVAERTTPAQILGLDWSRKNPAWEGRAQRGSKMLATRKNAALIAARVLLDLGQELPPQLGRAEAEFRALAAVAVATEVPPLPPEALGPPAATTDPSPAPFTIIRPKMKLDLGRWAHLLGAGPFAYGGVPSFAGISGGRTSAMMAALLDPRVKLCFENTGREKDATLQFLLRLADALGREIVWLEFRPPARKGAPPKDFGFAIVDYATCVKHDPRDPMAGGTLFEAMLQALADFRATKGLGPLEPHHNLKICTAYLKHRVQQAYMLSLGVDADDDQIQYIGLRADEPRRISDLRQAETQAKTLLTPLADAGVTKQDVFDFWSAQPFDLEIAHDREGNCGACFEKDDADLSRLLGEPWADAAWWIDIQRRYPGFGGRNKNSYAQLLSERDTRLAIETALRRGEEPVDDGRLTPKRFKLVVQNERSYLKGETMNFSCACEASLVQSARMDE